MMISPTAVPAPSQLTSMRSTPVPNGLLSEWLAEIDDLVELKLTLRVVWALHRKRGFPKLISQAELASDQTVARILNATGAGLEDALDAKLEATVTRGTLLRVDREPGRSARLFCLNTTENRRELARVGAATTAVAAGPDPEPWPAGDVVAHGGGAFDEYEQNIGPLTPVVIARLQEALQEHTGEAVVQAIRAAVDANARSWNYIAAVLRTQQEFRGPDGKPARGPEKARSDEFIRGYVARQRARGNR